jgi:thymidylate kinase
MGISSTIEGSEGAGKSFLQSLTGDLLTNTTNFPIYETREPGDTPFGEEMWRLTRDERFKDVDPIAKILMYSASRADIYFSRELPFLEKNPQGILLKDRGWLSTICLQTVDGGNIEYIRAVQEPFVKIPTKFVIIDIPVEETIARMEAEKRLLNRKDIDWRDQQTIENLERIRLNYLTFATNNDNRCVVLDCFDEPWQNAAKVKRLAMQCLGFPTDLGMEIIFAEEAKFIVETHTFRDINRDKTVLTYDLTEARKIREEVRIEFGLPNREELRHAMHKEWQDLGIEGGMSRREREPR